MAAVALILVTLGGAGAILARLLVLQRQGTLSWDREIRLVAIFPFAMLALVLLSRIDEPIARADPVLTGSVSAVALGALGAYALWLGRRYESMTQRTLGYTSLALAAAALMLTVVASLPR